MVFNKEKFNILIVDDKDSIFDITINALTLLKFNGKRLNYITATTSLEAIDILSKDDPADPQIALILLDIVMENNQPTGFDVITYVREEQANNITQIIMRTGQAGRMISDENSLVSAYNVNGFIDKAEQGLSKIRSLVLTSLRMYCLLKTIEKQNMELNKLMEKTECQKQDIQLLFLVLQNKFLSKVNTGLSFNDIKTTSHILLTEISNLHNKPISGFDKEALKILCKNQHILNDIAILLNTLNIAIIKSESNEIDSKTLQDSINLTINNFSSRMIWNQDNKDELENLYQILSGGQLGEINETLKFIDNVSMETFCKHFESGIYPDTKINWLAGREDFVYLFCFVLIEQDCFTKEFQDKMFIELSRHFLLKGKEINPRALSVTKSCIKKNLEGDEWTNIENYDFINKIVTNVF